MKYTATPLKDCWVITPQLIQDERGSFMEAFQQESFTAQIGSVDFIQDNEAQSSYGVIRGLHFQEGSSAQAKLVRVLQGRIIDIVIDLRPSSTTYMQQFRTALSAENKQQLFVPKGFAHGYAVVSERATVLYKVDAPYAPKSERGISPRDSQFLFDWGIPLEQQQINERDLNWPKYVKA
ncbi:MAG: dTDP-4-dehydrorhamnose 3,5-epimerase [Candidatus Arcticimaribacter sp.]